MNMQKITKLVARQIGASRAAVGKSGFKATAIFLVQPEVTLENMWDLTEIEKEDFFGYVRDWVLTNTDKDFEKLCDRYNLTDQDEANEKVCKMVRDRAVSCIWRPEVTFLPTFLFSGRSIAITWSTIPGRLVVWSNIFGWEVVAYFGRDEQFHFKNLNSAEMESKIENFFRFLKQIKGEEPKDLTKTE